MRAPRFRLRTLLWWVVLIAVFFAIGRYTNFLVSVVAACFVGFLFTAFVSIGNGRFRVLSLLLFAIIGALAVFAIPNSGSYMFCVS